MKNETKTFFKAAVTTAGIQLAFRLLNNYLYPTRDYTGSSLESVYFEGQKDIFQGAAGASVNKLANIFFDEGKFHKLKKLGYRLLTNALGGIAVEGLRTATTYALTQFLGYSADYTSKFLIEPRSLTGDVLPEIARSIILGTFALYLHDLSRTSEEPEPKPKEEAK